MLAARNPTTKAFRSGSMKTSSKPVFGILLCICASHAINDMLQSLLTAVYPTLQAGFGLSFAQIGLVTLSYQLTASMLQPLVGLYADRRPTPFSLPMGTLFTFAGLLMLSVATSYAALLVGACVLGVGSSVFHPEASRVARMASGGRPGLAQSLFQVGGHVGSALGPVGAAVVVVVWGQRSLGVFAGAALVSTAILAHVGLWVRRHGLSRLTAGRGARAADGGAPRPVPPARVAGAMAVLLALIFSKFVYLASFSNYYTFYLMHRFGISVRDAQLHLFALSAAVAAGTLSGGSLGDRFGRKHVIWFSILGVLPFTLALPHVGLAWTGALSIAIGFVMASAFPAIVVYGQDLLPSREGLVAGLFFGLSFGAAGMGAAYLGRLADAVGIERVYGLCAFLPALGILAAALPDLRRPSPEAHTPPITDAIDVSTGEPPNAERRSA
jgi:FSR family fosmidomycin resistance protein-like MFS transporter